MAISLGRAKNGYTLYHVLFTGLRRENLPDDFLFTYNGKKAPNLDYAIEHNWTGKRFMDSGEFPAHKKGIRLNQEDYIDYVNKYGKYLDAICTQDYIPRQSDGPDYMKIAPEITFRDYIYQRSLIEDPATRDKFIYIIHTDFANMLPRALEYRDDLGMPIRYIGAGISLSNRDLRMRQGAFYNEILAKYKYDGNVHGFGLQAADLIQKLPILTSSDSSSAVREQASGLLYYKGERIKIAEDTKAHHKGQFTDAQYKVIEPELRAYAEELGIDYDLARVNASERYLFNCRARSQHIKQLAADESVPPARVMEKRGLLSFAQQKPQTDWRQALTYTPELEEQIRARMNPRAVEYWETHKHLFQ